MHVPLRVFLLLQKHDVPVMYFFDFETRKDDMDGAAAVEFHRTVLLRLLAGLFEAAGMVPGGAPMARLPRPVRLMIARVLLPAESATKRLIQFISRRIVLPPKRERAASAKTAERAASRNSGTSAPSFWLFDRRKFFPELADKRRAVRRGPGPRLTDFGSFDAYRRREADDVKPVRDPDDAVRMCRRMLALYRALNDLEGQARRLLRAMAKRKQNPPGPGRYGPVRSGFPPGYRKNKTHEVDVILYECHMMTWLDKPPTLPPP